MARKKDIFPTRKKRATAKVHTIFVSMPNNPRVEVPAYPQRLRSETLSALLKRLATAAASGVKPSVADIQTIQHDYADKISRLVEIGLLTESLLPESLDQYIKDWEAWKRSKSKKKRSKHPTDSANKVRRILIRTLGYNVVSDIDGEAVQVTLNNMLGPKMSRQTAHHYVVQLKAFGRYLEEVKRVVPRNPMHLMTGYDASSDRRRVSREALDAEVGYLLEWVGEHGPERNLMDGPTRRLLYLVGFSTGIRAGALSDLTVADFDLEPDASGFGWVTVDAEIDKSKGLCNPLPPDLCEELADHFAERALHPSAKPFGGKWARVHKSGGKVLKDDLYDARLAWINEAADSAERRERRKTDFLKYVDRRGEQLDFHALKHTFLSNVGRNPNATLKSLQTLAGHQTATLALQRYIKPERRDLAVAVAGKIGRSKRA